MATANPARTTVMAARRLATAEWSRLRALDAAAALSAGWAEQRPPGGPHARDWQAYRAGGIQAMTDIAAELAPPGQPVDTLKTTP